MQNISLIEPTISLYVDGFTPNWKEGIITCAVYGYPFTDHLPNETVTIEELRKAVCHENGLVDVATLYKHNDTVTRFDNWITFDDYLYYEFESEAKQVLTAIINKRRAALC